MKSHRGKKVSGAEFARMWNDYGMTLAEIGARLNISEQAVRCRAAARGLPARPSYPRERFHLIRHGQEADFASMWRSGVGRREMADHFETNEQRIGTTAARLGLPKRELTRWNKITIEQWRERELAQKMAAAAAEELRAAAEVWRRAA
jgi:hypothetical protein